jgi:hypothetical protein
MGVRLTKEDAMRFMGSAMFDRCRQENHKECPHYDMFDEIRPSYVSCACPCHEARECAAYDEERDRVAARKNEFIANVEAVFGHKIGGE